MTCVLKRITIMILLLACGSFAQAANESLAAVQAQLNQQAQSRAMPGGFSGANASAIAQLMSSLTPEQRQQLMQEVQKLAKDNPQLLKKMMSEVQKNPQAAQAMLKQFTSQGGATQTNQTNQTNQITQTNQSRQAGLQLTNQAGQQMTPEEYDQKIRDSVFESILKSAFPLSSKQIYDLHSKMDQTQRDAATPANFKSPKPVSSTMVVNVAPGEAPPAIRLAKGYVSTLLFLDSTGAPWPLDGYDIGDPNKFGIVWDRKSNMLMIQGLAAYANTNMAVKLHGMNTPVIFSLVTGQPVVDFRLDIRVPGVGPQAKPTLDSKDALPPGANPLMLGFLDGLAPKGAKRLQVNQNLADVWLYQKHLYIRTRYTMISPAWLGTMSSADGTKVYELQKTPLVLLSRHGNVAQLKIEGY